MYCGCSARTVSDLAVVLDIEDPICCQTTDLPLVCDEHEEEELSAREADDD